jgi:hypothetical protein
MKTKAMILLALWFFSAGCERSQTATNSRDVQAVLKTQAQPFHGQIYKALDGKIVLTLISKDECELSEGEKTLLCKYTKQDEKLRIVITALGTTQVVYYRITSQGLQDNEGRVLLAPGPYAEAITHLEEERRKRQNEYLERQRAEEKRMMEEQRIAEVRTNSTRQTKVITTIPLHSTMQTFQYGQLASPSKITITDVSLVLHVNETAPAWDNVMRKHEIQFAALREIRDVGKGTPVNAFFVDEIDQSYAPYDTIFSKSEAEARLVHDALVEVFNAWKAKFPEAVVR